MQNNVRTALLAFKRHFIWKTECPSGKNNRLIKTAEVCRGYLRHNYASASALVEEFIIEIESVGRTRDVSGWLTDITGMDEEMLKRLDKRFTDWLNPT